MQATETAQWQDSEIPHFLCEVPGMVRSSLSMGKMIPGQSYGTEETVK